MWKREIGIWTAGRFSHCIAWCRALAARVSVIALLVILPLTVEGCRQRGAKKPADEGRTVIIPEPHETPSEGSEAARLVSPPSPDPTRSFKTVALPKEDAWRWYLKEYTEAQRRILQKLNRRDLLKIRPADQLIIPEHWDYGPLAYSPLPTRVEWAGQFEKAVIVSLRSQCFAAYESGALVRWGPVNSGRRQTPTPSGFFHLNWKARERISTDNPEWLLRWYFNLVNETGVSFHQYGLPGYPASHACLRLLESDAEWLYGWGEQWKLDPILGQVAEPGTPVLIMDAYTFGSGPPWKRLAEDPEADHVTVDQIAEAAMKMRPPPGKAGKGEGN